MNGRIAILSVLMGVGLTACGAEQGGFEGPPDGAKTSTESVGSVSNAFNIASQDRQPAAVVLRGWRGTFGGLPITSKDLYVFICDNHQIKVRTKGLFGWSLGWQSVGVDFPCDSAPSVGVIHTTGSSSSDILGVYWRSDESLIEAWYRKDGTMAVTNLLDYDPGHVPAIAGSPQVSDTSDPTKIQVVVRRSANGQIWTIAWTGSAYASLPVKRANGTIFTTNSNDFYTMYNAGYGREYISIEDTTNFKHLIFTRPSASWGTSFTEFASVSSNFVVRGMLSIGGIHSFVEPNCQTGFALRLEEANIVEGSCLDAGGSLTRWNQVTSGQDATLYGAPEMNTNWLFGAQAGTFGNPDRVWLTTADPLITQGTMPWNATGIISAMVQPKGGSGYVFWAKNVAGVRHLMVADYASSGDPNNAALTDLGGNLLY